MSEKAKPLGAVAVEGRAAMEAILPHREPFLFVDRVEASIDGKIRASRKFVEGDFFFRGHFPQYPVVPGVILVETMAQAGGAGARIAGTAANGLAFLATVDKAKFRRQVRPGDTLDMEIENLRVSARMIRQAGKGYVAGELAVEAEWLCLIGDNA